MTSDAPTREHVFLPIVARAQLVMCGLVLSAGAVLGAASAVDLHAVRALFGV